MSEPDQHQELLRDLNRVGRGLSSLFWSLPVALIACVKTATKSRIDLELFDFLPPVLSTVWIFYSLRLLGAFRRQERVWQTALERARIFNLVMIGFSPFIYFWARFPEQPYFIGTVLFLSFCALVFLVLLNQMLRRLAAMLPDQTLRLEVRFFSSVNTTLLLAIPSLIGLIRLARFVPWFAGWRFVEAISVFTPWMLLFLLLVPLAMTMALIWKSREVVLHGVFGE